MNKVLAAMIRGLNGLLALVIVAVGAIVGSQYGATVGAQHGADQQQFFGGLVAGLLVGSLAALAICGVLALFVEMRSELIKIRMLLETTRDGMGRVQTDGPQRVEPRQAEVP